MKGERIASLYKEALLRVDVEDRSDCLSPERMQMVAERQLPESERLAALDHIMRCPQCVREFELLRAIVQPDPKPKKSVWVPTLAAAASVTLLIAAGLWQMTRSPNQVFRGDSDTIRLVEPSGRVPVESMRLFRWTGAGADVTYRLEIFNPDGSVLFDATTRDTVFALGDSVLFRPGQTYSWWIRATSLDGTVRTTVPMDLQVVGN